jgi:hypothetical protein
VPARRRGSAPRRPGAHQPIGENAPDVLQIDQRIAALERARRAAIQIVPGLAEQAPQLAMLIVDLPDPSKIPALAEPWFLTFEADAEFRVVMSPDGPEASRARRTSDAARGLAVLCVLMPLYKGPAGVHNSFSTLQIDVSLERHDQVRKLFDADPLPSGEFGFAGHDINVRVILCGSVNAARRLSSASSEDFAVVAL